MSRVLNLSLPISENTNMPSFTSLAEDILTAAKRLDEHLASQGKTMCSFDEDTLEDLPHDMEATRSRLINTTQTLKQLAQGPHGATMESMFSASLSFHHPTHISHPYLR